MDIDEKLKELEQSVMDDKVKGEAEKIKEPVQVGDIKEVREKVIVTNPETGEQWEKKRGRKPSWVQNLIDSGNYDANIKRVKYEYDKPIQTVPVTPEKPKGLFTSNVPPMPVDEAIALCDQLLDLYSEVLESKFDMPLDPKEKKFGMVMCTPLCIKYGNYRNEYPEIMAGIFVYKSYSVRSAHFKKKKGSKKFSEAKKDLEEKIKDASEEKHDEGTNKEASSQS